jgi:hypothetical protein
MDNVIFLAEVVENKPVRLFYSLQARKLLILFTQSIYPFQPCLRLDLLYLFEPQER